jgi:DNA replication protein DnaC
MKYCRDCGEPYKENENWEELQETLKDYNFLSRLQYVPSCNCSEIKAERQAIEEEKALVRERIMNRVRKFKNISVVDKKFIESRFENADMSEKHMLLAKRYAEKFIEKNGSDVGIILYGDVGTGKTFSTACIANHLMGNGKTVLALSLNGYLNKLRSEWAEAERDVLDHVKNCDLLILDDFGSEKKTEWVIEKIFTLIDTRYRSGKPMIISTNLNFNNDRKLCEITKYFSIDGKDRIKDRIKEMCYPVLIEGESKRKVSQDKFKAFLA